MDELNMVQSHGALRIQQIGELLQSDKLRELAQNEEQDIACHKERGQLSVVVKVNDLNQFVPDDERVELADSDRVSRLSNAGILSKVDGMGQIRGRLDDAIYAVIKVDEKGVRWYEFCQKLTDGGYSPKLSIRQADLFRLCNCQFQVERIANRVERRKAATSLSTITDAYLNSLFASDMRSIYDILLCLCDASQQLPVQYEEEGGSIEELYERIIQILEYEEPRLVFEKKRAYYMLQKPAMEELARMLGMPRLKLLKILKENRLLFLQESAEGYESKVKVYGVGVDFYCIFDLEYLLEKAGLIEPKSYTDPLDLG